MKTKIVAALSALVALLGASATGCQPDTPELDFLAEPQPVVHGTDPSAVAIAQGAAVAVVPYMVQEDVEGTSSYGVSTIRPDDPTILGVVETQDEHVIPGSPNDARARAFVMTGLAAGTTTLRFYQGGGYEAGSLLVQVVAQDR